MRVQDTIWKQQQQTSMIWCWESDGHGDARWDIYSCEDSAKLEATFRKFHRAKDIEDTTVVLYRGDSSYLCDVRKMQQTNLETGFVRNIHRGWPGVNTEGIDEEENRADEEEREEDWVDEEEVNFLT